MKSDKKIREQFKSKLSDYKVPVLETEWERLEESLNLGAPAVNRTSGKIWRYVGTAAAIAVLIVGSILFINNPMNEVGNEGSPQILSQTPVQSEFKEKDKSSNSPKIEVHESVLMAKRSDLIENVNKELITEAKNVIENHVKGIKKSAEEGKSVTEEMAYEALMEELIFIAKEQDKLLAENVGASENNRLLLSVGGKGGLTSFYQSVSNPMTLRSAAIANDAKLPEESDKMLFQNNRFKDNIAEMEHNQPVSFGITLSKSLIDGLYLETGLVYSYLYSKSKNTSTGSQNHQTQSLHYLGIPLNLNYNLFALRDLNVYASLGGMIEKDVYGKFSEVGEGQSIEEDIKSEVLVNENISQRNPQLSVNAGLGLSYPLYRDLKLYGKIGGAYYFDANNDFKTIYSDRKIVMDLSVGIRYEFK